MKGYANEMGTNWVRSIIDPLVFISADDHLNTAAEQEGLKVDNPNFHA